MENALISFNVVAPIFLLLLLGYFIKRLHMLDTHTEEVMNKISFQVFFSVLLFNSIYKTDLKSSFRPKLLLFAVAAVLLLFVLLCLIVPLIEKQPAKRGVLIQGIFRSNFVIFGLPICISLCGEESIGATSILIAVIVPIYNALSIVALEMHRGNGAKLSIVKILKGIFTNPLVLGGIAGIIALLLQIRLPTAVESVVNDVAKIATPLALILLGASFQFSDIKGNLKQITIGVLGKLVVVPLVIIPIAILFGFRGAELVAIVVMIAAPVAVSTYTMARQLEGDSVLAGQLVVFDSIGAILTMFLWIFSLKSFGLF